MVDSFLLLEDGASYLLQEDSASKIIIEDEQYAPTAITVVDGNMWSMNLHVVDNVNRGVIVRNLDPESYLVIYHMELVTAAATLFKIEWRDAASVLYRPVISIDNTTSPWQGKKMRLESPYKGGDMVVTMFGPPGTADGWIVAAGISRRSTDGIL